MQGRALDDIDLALLRALRQDARRSIRQLAEEVHISRSSAHTRVRALMDAGIVTGFSTDLDLTKAGLPVHAVLAIDTGATPAGSELATELVRIPFVSKVLTIAGDVDYIVEISAPSHEVLSEIVLRGVLRLPGVTSVRTHLVIAERSRDPLGSVD